MRASPEDFLLSLGNAALERMRARQYIAMFHIGRCGSTVLNQMLKQHPRISSAGEIFNAYNNREQQHASRPNPQRFVRRRINRNRLLAPRKHFLFETKYLPQQHLSARCINLDLRAYLAQLRELGFAKFILLHRKNYLRRLISGVEHRQTGVKQTRDVRRRPTRVTLNLDAIPLGGELASLQKWFARFDESYARLKELTALDATLDLIYEDDILPDPQIAYQKACAFLGAPAAQVRVTLRRTNPFSPRELLVNYAQVEATLKNTPHEWMLYD